MDVLIHLGYALLALFLLGGGWWLQPRVEQLWRRFEGRRLRRMPEYANDVEECNARLVSLYMQTAEEEAHWAWLMENAPEKYDDKLFLAWSRNHQVGEALLRHAQKLGRYKPEFGWKAMAACLDDSPVYSADVCPHARGQVSIPAASALLQSIPPPPAMPSVPPVSKTMPPPVSVEQLRRAQTAMITSVSSAFASDDGFVRPPEGPAELPAVDPAPALTKRSFMVHDGGKLRPMRSGTE